MTAKSESRYATFAEVTAEMQRRIEHPYRLACVTCTMFEHADEMTVKEYDITEPATKVFSMHGFCRRYAPRPVLDLEGDGRAAWPIVDYKRDYCGEHRLITSIPAELADRYTLKTKPEHE